MSITVLLGRVRASLVRISSGFNPHAVSPSGAQGLGQLIPSTARKMGVQNPFDVEDNLRGSLAYLKQLVDLWAGYPDQIERALASYNAGPRTVRNAQAEARKAGLNPDEFAGVSRFLPKETQNYVPRVLARLPQVAPKFQPTAKPALSASYLSQTRGPMLRQLLRPAAAGEI